MSTPWTNFLTKEQADASNMEYDRRMAADAALGAKVLEARGLPVEWTAVEKRVAAADLAATEERAAQEWQAAAQKKLDSIDLTLDGHVDADAWLEAAKARCQEVEVELRGSTAPFTH